MRAAPGSSFAHVRLATVAVAVALVHGVVLTQLPSCVPTAAPPEGGVSLVMVVGETPQRQLPPERVDNKGVPTRVESRAPPLPRNARAAEPQTASAPAFPSATATQAAVPVVASSTSPQGAAVAATAVPVAPAGATPNGPPQAGMAAPAGTWTGAGGVAGAEASVAKAVGTGHDARQDAARTQEPTLTPQYLNNPPLDYPRQSAQRGEQGRVLVQVLVGVDGLPQKTELKASSGHPRLDQAALDSVLRWRFVAGRRDGVAQPMWVTVPVQFVLR